MTSPPPPPKKKDKLYRETKQLTNEETDKQINIQKDGQIETLSKSVQYNTTLIPYDNKAVIKLS